jgi:hypothetical protein
MSLTHLHQYKERPILTNKFLRNAFDIFACVIQRSRGVPSYSIKARLSPFVLARARPDPVQHTESASTDLVSEPCENTLMTAGSAGDNEALSCYLCRYTRLVGSVAYKSCATGLNHRMRIRGVSSGQVNCLRLLCNEGLQRFRQ